MRSTERLVDFATILLAAATLCGCDAVALRPTTAASTPLRCSGSTVVGSSDATAIDGPEIATGFAGKDVFHSHTIIAVTANPFASRAACDVLAAGGSAVDAAVAAQMVLNLVEPQSSGLGGGAFLVHFDARTGAVESYDGRETAPAAATAGYLRFVDETADRTTPKPSIRASGRSIGVPGALRMLELAQRDHGRLPWRRLFDPAIALATDGFRISPRMSASIDSARFGLARDRDAADYFLDGTGRAKPAGTLLKNPDLAATLKTIATNGADAFYRGDIAQAIVAKVDARVDGVTAGRMTVGDLANYAAKRRDPICTTYRTWWVCGMGPPSSGGIAVASTLGILEHFDLAAMAPRSPDRDGGRPSVEAVHLIAEAERLAYADRDRYVADTDFVPLPGGSPTALLDRTYLAARAKTIDPGRSMGRAAAGDFGPIPFGVSDVREHGTTQLTIADAEGNVVTMTTTVESAFGSFHFVRGFALNNQLTDFSIDPMDAAGAPIANRVAGGKRPRSAMAPTLVFAKKPDGSRGAFVLATGSAGGFVIIQHVVKALVGALDWKLDAQQAVSLIDFGAANSPVTYIGSEHPAIYPSDDGAHDPLVSGLRRLGHVVSVAPHSSGLTMLRRVEIGGRPGWAGGADPRREGAAVGDAAGR